MIQFEKSVILEAMRSVLPGVEKGTSGIEGANLFLFKKQSFIHLQWGDLG